MERLAPLHHKRTRIILLLHSYLDALQGTTDTLPGDQRQSKLLLHNQDLWPKGSYHHLDKLLDELRILSRRGSGNGVYNSIWSVYVIGSKRHMNRRRPKAELGLDWLVKHMPAQIYVPLEIAQNAGYLQSEAMSYATQREQTQLKDAA